MSAASSLVSEIVVTMENNTGKKARTAKLTIKAEGVEGTKVVTIEQASKEDLVVVPYDELVPTEGGSITFTIASNRNCDTARQCRRQESRHADCKN